MTYTYTELRAAVGTDVEYIMPDQVWTNYIKKGELSFGRLNDTFGEQVSVYDFRLDGIVRTLSCNVTRIPYIDAIKDTKLFKVVTQ